MASKNIGQVAGLFIGNTAPVNLNLIWYDNTPNQLCHKIYDFNLLQWIPVNQSILSSITYNELVALAADPGLALGKLFVISDRSNTVALSISTTKVQYTDTTGNLVIDDLGTNLLYFVSSGNYMFDNVDGVFDNVTKKLNFSVEEIMAPDINTTFLFGKSYISDVWKLVRIKLSKMISATTGNSITWNNGIYLDFNTKLRSLLNTAGGAVGYNQYVIDMANINQQILAIGNNYSTLLATFSAAINTAVSDANIYNKQLPQNIDTTVVPVDIAQGDTLLTIISKIQRYINKFKYATGIFISSGYADAISELYVTQGDSIEVAFSKVQYLIKVIKRAIVLQTGWVPDPYTGDIADLAVGDTMAQAFAKIQGKLNQIGTLSDGIVESKQMVIVDNEEDAVTNFNLKNGWLKFKNTLGNYIGIYGGNNPSFTINEDSDFESISISKRGMLSQRGKVFVQDINSLVHRGGIVSKVNDNLEVNSGEDSLVGVFGSALNNAATPVPSYGGWFEKMMVQGLFLGIKRVVNATTYLTIYDTYVTCLRKTGMTVYLPENPYLGCTIFLKVEVPNSDVVISGNGKSIYNNVCDANDDFVFEELVQFAGSKMLMLTYIKFADGVINSYAWDVTELK